MLRLWTLAGLRVAGSQSTMLSLVAVTAGTGSKDGPARVGGN